MPKIEGPRLPTLQAPAPVESSTPVVQAPVATLEAPIEAPIASGAAEPVAHAAAADAARSGAGIAGFVALEQSPLFGPPRAGLMPGEHALGPVDPILLAEARRVDVAALVLADKDAHPEATAALIAVLGPNLDALRSKP
jgi:hypothetical protein